MDWVVKFNKSMVCYGKIGWLKVKMCYNNYL